MVVRKSFNSFLKDIYTKNAWIVYSYDLNIYMRKTPFSLRRYFGDIQLATISCKKPGRGKLTRFLNHYEPKFQFYIENVFEERLQKYFERRGYKKVKNNDGPPSYLGPTPKGKTNDQTL